MSGIRAAVVLSILLAAFSCGVAAGEEWGDLELRLVYDGEPPDIPAAAPGLPLHEELLVNPGNHGIANMLFYLQVGPGKKVSASPKIEEAILPKETLNVLPDKFSPRVLVVHRTQRLRLVNLSGSEVHLKSELFNPKAFPGLMPAGGKLEVRLPESPSFAIAIFNALQPRHQSWVFVADHRYATVSDKDGNIKLSKLPVGKHTFVVWHEIPGYVKEAQQGGMPVEWKRGRMIVEIAPGENDLGEFLLKPEVFKR
jgi:hypothetical protein